MWGGYLHNEILIAPLIRLLEAAGATVHTEFPVRIGRQKGFIDALAELASERIAIEAECSADRVHNDARKAAAASATELWIVTADPQTARRARRRLRLKGVEKFSGGSIFILTLGQAIQRLTNYFPNVTDSSDEQKNRKHLQIGRATS